MSTALTEIRTALLDLEVQVKTLRERVEAALDSEAQSSSAAAGYTTDLSPAWSSEWEVALAAASTPELLARLDLSPLDSVTGVNRLTQVDNWTPRLRLARAFRAGFLARKAILAGSTIVPPSPELRVRHSLVCHVVLSCPKYPQGFWSSSCRPFLQLIGDPTGRGQEPSPPTSIHHSFHSKTEAAAYLLGAQRQWPQLEL